MSAGTTNTSEKGLERLKCRFFTFAYPLWSANLTLSTSKPFQYKYLKKNESSKVYWESGDNRTASTSASCSQSLNDTWR